MTDPAKCHCGSISWERRIEETRYICAHCKRPLWQPIATAPKNGQSVLGHENGWSGTIRYWSGRKKGWVDEIDQYCSPSHWMPMPEGPGE
jgi:hypothetical protein